MIDRRFHRQGVVLLMVIAVFVVCLMTMAVVARRTLELSRSAAEQTRDLQRRWAVASAEAQVFPLAERIFKERIEARVKNGNLEPLTTLRDALTLNNVTIDMLIGDEDAKLNLNLLHRSGGASDVEKALRDTIPPSAFSAVRLRPLEANSGGQSGMRFYPSWGQVFDLERLGQQTGTTLTLPNLCDRLTVDGSQALNIRRATDEAISSVAELVVPAATADRFVDRYRSTPAADVELLILTTVRNRRDQERLKALFSQESSNFSMWVNASSRTGVDLRRLIVSRRDEFGETHTERFGF
ncbi:MAG: hypothetical protein AAF664_07170 [Planctomycetota bacterium]